MRLIVAIDCHIGFSSFGTGLTGSRIAIGSGIEAIAASLDFHLATFTACCIITDVAADCCRRSSCYCCTNCHSNNGYFALMVIKARSSIDPVHIVSTNTTLNLFLK